MNRIARFQPAAGEDGSIWSSTFDKRSGYQPILSLRWQKDIKKLLRTVERDEVLMSDRVIAALLPFVKRNSTNTQRLAQFLGRPGVLEKLDELYPFDDPPEGNALAGPVRIGTCVDGGGEFGLLPRELVQSMLIVGRSGAGKTSLCYNIVEHAVMDCGIKVVVFDPKRDYRHLLRRIPKTAVISAKNLEPLVIPSGVSRNTHISNVTDLLSEAQGVYQGTNNYLAQHLGKLYDMRRQPTLRDLYEAVLAHKITDMRSRDHEYKSSALNRLGGMLVKSGQDEGVRKVFRLEKLLEACNLIVIELADVGMDGKLCYTSLGLGTMYEFREENNLRGERAQPALAMFDEGNDIFPKRLEEERGGRLKLTSMLRQFREFQLGAVAACHLSKPISDTLKSVYTRVLLSLPEGHNLDDIAKSLGLNYEQRDMNFKLPEGRAIVRMAGRYFEPFVMDVLPYLLEKDVSDDEVRRHMEPYFESLAEELSAPGPVELAAEAEVRDAPGTNGSANEKQNGSGAGDREPSDGLSANAKLFLSDIYLRPFLNISTRYKGFNPSASSTSAGDSIKGQLLRRGLCEVIEIVTGGQGSFAKYIAITEAGFAALGVEPNYKINPSNFCHSFWQDWIAKWASPIGKVEIEKLVQNKHIDVAVTTERGLIAIEVELTSAYTKQNIEKDLAVGCVKIILACGDGKVLEEAQGIVERLDASAREKVQACLLTELRKNEPEKVLS